MASRYEVDWLSRSLLSCKSGSASQEVSQKYFCCTLISWRSLQLSKTALSSCSYGIWHEKDSFLKSPFAVGSKRTILTVCQVGRMGVNAHLQTSPGSAACLSSL